MQNSWTEPFCGRLPVLLVSHPPLIPAVHLDALSSSNCSHGGWEMRMRTQLLAVWRVWTLMNSMLFLFRNLTFLGILCFCLFLFWKKDNNLSHVTRKGTGKRLPQIGKHTKEIFNWARLDFLVLSIIWATKLKHNSWILLISAMGL